MYHIYYDTLCPVCRRSRRTLERLDLRRQLVFRDIHDRPTMREELPGVSYQQALREMFVRAPRGQAYSGFDAFRALAWALPPLWLFLPLLYLPGVAWLGRRVYRHVARNRYRLYACHDDVCNLHLQLLSSSDLDSLSEEQIANVIHEARQLSSTASNHHA